MKRNILDKLVGVFSPRAEFNRLRFRQATELVRSYDGASLFNTSDWSSARRTGPNAENRQDIPVLRDRSRDLYRNSPYANKAKNVIVSNGVGAGIIPKISGRTKFQEKLVNRKWKEWGETSLCDSDGLRNFYGLQAAALGTIVDSGEILGKKVYRNGIAKIQLLEPDFINPNFNNNIDNIQGIYIDDLGNVVGYELWLAHPGESRLYNLKSVRVDADQIIRAYKVERVGQLRGVPWAYPVMNTLKDFADFQNSTLVRQKVAACVTAFVTESEGQELLSPEKLKAQRETENALEPASIRYLAKGQSMTLASPPGVDQYDPFARQTLRSIAAGFGISYESLTGDYSQVNFSSGRMGHLEMQRNIDMWRWQMLIPQFCEPAFKFFLNWLQIQGIDIDGVTVQWTPPAREMIDPTKEIASLKDEVRAGFKSLPEAIRERGLDPETVLNEIKESNDMLDELEIVLDTDPRKLTAQGMNQPVMKPAAADSSNSDSNNGDSNNNGQNKEDNASDKPDKSGTK